MNYQNVVQKLKRKKKHYEIKFHFNILSIAAVLISKLILGSLAVESTIVAVVVVDDDADGEDDTPLI